MAIRGTLIQGAIGWVAGAAIVAMALPAAASDGPSGPGAERAIDLQERRRRRGAQRHGPGSASAPARRTESRQVQRLRGRRPPGHRLLRDQRSAARPGAPDRQQREHGAEAAVRAEGGGRLRRRAARRRPRRGLRVQQLRPPAAGLYRRSRPGPPGDPVDDRWPAAPRSTTPSTWRCAGSTKGPWTVASGAAPSSCSPTARTPPVS